MEAKQVLTVCIRLKRSNLPLMAILNERQGALLGRDSS